MSILLLPAVSLKPAAEPIAMLLLPLLFSSAVNPKAQLSLPVLFSFSADVPVAMLCCPVMF
jgi:hypothetical protein